MVKEIIISGRKIGEKHPCFVIAEAGVNHNGDIKIAKKLVDVAVAAGADAVKFQTFKAESIVTKSAWLAPYQAKTNKKTQFEMIKELELTFSDFIALKKYCDEKGIIFLSTPFDLESATFLNSIVPAFKISSGDIPTICF